MMNAELRRYNERPPELQPTADFTAKHRVPAISMFRSFTEAGGLMSYGANQPEYYKRVPFYIDKILKGANPADLPIEQPTKFDLVINLTKARRQARGAPQEVRRSREPRTAELALLLVSRTRFRRPLRAGR